MSWIRSLAKQFTSHFLGEIYNLRKELKNFLNATTFGNVVVKIPQIKILLMVLVTLLFLITVLQIYLLKIWVKTILRKIIIASIIYWMDAAQKLKFSIKNFFSKCDQIHTKLQIWSLLLEKSLMENFIFWAVEILIEDITVRRNNNEKSKNSGKSLLVVKQNPGNQTIFARKALTDDFHKDGCNIKTFCDSFPKAIMIKELNQYTDNRNLQLRSISRATTNQLLHYLGINIDNNTETILIYVVVNDILNSDANMSWLLLSMKNIVNMVGIRHIFVSGLIYIKSSKIGVLKEVHKKSCRWLKLFRV